jgi:hypothetical protein
MVSMNEDARVKHPFHRQNFVHSQNEWLRDELDGVYSDKILPMISAIIMSLRHPADHVNPQWVKLLSLLEMKCQLRKMRGNGVVHHGWFPDPRFPFWLLRP